MVCTKNWQTDHRNENVPYFLKHISVQGTYEIYSKFQLAYWLRNWVSETYLSEYIRIYYIPNSVQEIWMNLSLLENIW
jgi:hypothetical protein